MIRDMRLVPLKRRVEQVPGCRLPWRWLSRDTLLEFCSLQLAPSGDWRAAQFDLDFRYVVPTICGWWSRRPSHRAIAPGSLLRALGLVAGPFACRLVSVRAAVPSLLKGRELSGRIGHTPTDGCHR